MSENTIRHQRTGRRTRRATVTAALAAGACAVTIALAAPASATVDVPQVSPGLGGKFATTCTYDVTVPVSGVGAANPVTLRDGSIIVGTVVPIAGKATFKWTPSTAGSHNLTAVQLRKPFSPSVKTLNNIPVSQGLNLGSLCLAL